MAIPDHRLAELLGVPSREVIDLARELLDHLYVVVAETQAPAGRWLASTESDLVLARAHLRSLHDRGVSILARASALGRAIDARSTALRSDGRGQLSLFSDTEQPVINNARNSIAIGGGHGV